MSASRITSFQSSFQKYFLIASLLMAPIQGFSSEIEQVLRNSEQRELDKYPTVDASDPRIQVLQKALDQVIATLDQPIKVELRAVAGEIVAEALLERYMVVNVGLANYSSGEMAFTFAHEAGHIVLNHFRARADLYTKHIPGAVTPETTNPIQHLLGPEAHALAHAQEFEADEFAFKLIKKLGYNFDDVMLYFQHMGLRNDTATHPATRKRIAKLRMLD